MMDDEQSMLLRELERELKEALRPVIAEIASMRRELSAFNQRIEIGTPPSLPEAIRDQLAASQRGEKRAK